MVSRTESQDATQACLDAIAAHDDTVHAMITVTADAALRQAEAADKAAAQGRWLGLDHPRDRARSQQVAIVGALRDDVQQHHRNPGVGDVSGDAAAHDAGAEDPDFSNIGHLHRLEDRRDALSAADALGG